jgi:hypothetical protein
MPISETLRRATLNGAGLALFAGLACATPAAAQSLNIDDTLSYINQRCSEHVSGARYHQSVSLHRNKIALMRWRPPLHDGRPGTIGGSYEYYVHVFDLRAVEVITYNNGNVYFSCGAIDCISGANIHPRSSLLSVGDVVDAAAAQSSKTTSTTFQSCREPDRVFNAFKHLQQLLGGRIPDPVDPFAN